MKRILLLTIVSGLYMMSSAQFLVKQNGRVGIGVANTSQNLYNKFSVYSNTSSLSTLAYFRGDSCDTGLGVSMGDQKSSTTYRCALAVDNELNPNTHCIGIQATAFRESDISTGYTYGLKALAGRGAPGYNYGVCTALGGTNNGAALYASAGNNQEGSWLTDKYAGYFDGKVKVVGTLHATTITSGSDYRLKTDIRNVEENSLGRIMEMNVVRYKIKQMEVEAKCDTTGSVHYKYEPDSPILKKDHFGLIAQELREIYPDIVYEEGDGYLSVNYMELIPILIKSIQELNAKVEELENPASKSVMRNGTSEGTTGIRATAQETTALFQTNPNPFTENTVIECAISSDVKNATLYIYDMNGRQIDSMPIENRGRVSLTIQGGSLDAGIYMYTLITDSQVVDTKRIIITK